MAGPAAASLAAGIPELLTYDEVDMTRAFCRVGHQDQESIKTRGGPMRDN